MPQTRCEPRNTFGTTVRVFGLDGRGRPLSQPVTTVDVSRRGARITGVHAWEQPGEIIGLRYGEQKARYKVVWIGKAGTPQQGQVGLVCVEAGKVIWGIAAPTPLSGPHAATIGPGTSRLPRPVSPPAVLGPAPALATQNRRRDSRYVVEGGINVRQQGAVSGQWATIQDISLGGCYVETSTPLPLDAVVEASLTIGDVQFRAHGVVSKSDRLVGMGIKFTELARADRERLESLIAKLVVSGKPA